jgi:glycerol-3-phosphate dehydrogenase (NAD(P)+)
MAHICLANGDILSPMKVTVLGAGSWGTALSVLLARNSHDVTLAGRDPEEIGFIRAKRENIKYLPGFMLPQTVIPTLIDDCGPSDAWVVAVPANAVSSVTGAIKGEAPSIVVASKGLEPGTGAMVSEIVQREIPTAKVAAISGPNLAVEIMRGVPTAAVVASAEPGLAELGAQWFNCKTFRAYISDDLIGVELAGALKNVLAISAGMSDGLGFGDNTKGALVARGLLEMTRLGTALGACATTFFGIAGVGDLFATANSKLSRNYRVGFALGQGSRLADILGELGQVAEGVGTAEAAMILARRHSITVPIFEMTDAVIRGRLQPREGVTMLMDRMPKCEGWESLPLTPRESGQ